MRHFISLTAFALASACVAHAALCDTDPLTTYTNGGSLFSCTEANGLINIEFNNTSLLSYAGLSLLSGNSADPGDITVNPGLTSIDFNSNTFTDSGLFAASQAELVHFSVFSSGPSLLTDTFSIHNPQTSSGDLAVGTGLVVGQELICVGGTFTSLPTGLVTTIANGVVGTGNFGCNGTVLVGTAGDSAGPLSALTGLLGLPDLTGLSDSATIQLSPFSTNQIDVIKIQALLSIGGGQASTTGFGDSFATAAPESSSILMLLGGLLTIMATRAVRRKA